MPGGDLVTPNTRFIDQYYDHVTREGIDLADTEYFFNYVESAFSKLPIEDSATMAPSLDMSSIPIYDGTSTSRWLRKVTSALRQAKLAGDAEEYVNIIELKCNDTVLGALESDPAGLAVLKNPTTPNAIMTLESFLISRFPDDTFIEVEDAEQQLESFKQLPAESLTEYHARATKLLSALGGRDEPKLSSEASLGKLERSYLRRILRKFQQGLFLDELRKEVITSKEWFACGTLRDALKVVNSMAEFIESVKLATAEEEKKKNSEFFEQVKASAGDTIKLKAVLAKANVTIDTRQQRQQQPPFNSHQQPVFTQQQQHQTAPHQQYQPPPQQYQPAAPSQPSADTTTGSAPPASASTPGALSREYIVNGALFSVPNNVNPSSSRNPFINKSQAFDRNMGTLCFRCGTIGHITRDCTAPRLAQWEQAILREMVMSTSDRKPLPFLSQLASIQALDESEAMDMGAPPPQHDTPIGEHILHRQRISTHIKNQRLANKKKTVSFEEFDRAERSSKSARIKQLVLYSDDEGIDTKSYSFDQSELVSDSDDDVDSDLESDPDDDDELDVAYMQSFMADTRPKRPRPMSDPEHGPIRRKIEVPQYFDRHIKPLKKNRSHGDTSKPSKSSNATLENVSLKPKSPVLPPTEKTTKSTTDPMPTVTAQKYTKKKSRGLQEIHGRLGKGPVDYIKLLESIQVPLNLLELLQVSPDFAKHLRHYSTRANTKPIRKKRSYKDMQPTVEDDLNGDTLLAQIGELDLASDEDDFVSDDDYDIELPPDLPRMNSSMARINPLQKVKAYHRFPNLKLKEPKAFNCIGSVMVRPRTGGALTEVTLLIDHSTPDQGSDVNVVTDSFVIKFNIKRRPIRPDGKTALVLTLANGGEAGLSEYCIFTYAVAGIWRRISAFIRPDNRKIPGEIHLLLGMPWLHSVDAVINIRAGTISIGDSALGEEKQLIRGPLFVESKHHGLALELNPAVPARHSGPVMTIDQLAPTNRIEDLTESELSDDVNTAHATGSASYDSDSAEYTSRSPSSDSDADDTSSFSEN